VARVRRRTARAGLRRLLLPVLALLAAVLLGGCGGGGYTPAGPFRPLPEGEPPEVGPPQGTSPAPAPNGPANPQSGQQAGDPNVVASNLSVPTGLAVLPDGSAVVGERATGRLLQVFPDRSPAKVLMTVGGLSAAGDGGLLSLALSPTFAEDGLLYAYISTATDNRVVRFPIGGTPNPVLTGIPHGTSRNGGGMLFTGDGTLLVGTGDTGDPALAADPTSLAGKVLHVDVFGRPVGAGPVYATGLGDVTALCTGGDGKVFATDVAPAGGQDEVDQLAEGADYGAGPDAVPPVVTVPAGQGGLGGCAVTGHTVFAGALDGQKLDVVTLSASKPVTGKVADVLAGRYGRLRTTVLDADGGLWLTTSNRDGIGTPAADDDRVLRIVPPSSTGGSPL
jgi:glucose/arabinose dehydrogenase